MRENIKHLIEANDVCVLATVSGGDPHCSLMSYAANEDCREIYMATQKNTKKYRNLDANPSVSLLIDSREVDRENRRARAKALTVTGVFQRITDQARKMEIKKRFLDRHPHLQSFVDQPDAEMIVVRVKALQLLDGISDAFYEVVP